MGEHPTQALLDVYTIWDELGLTLDVDGGDSENEKKHKGQLVVVLLGDLKHGRTVHSLAKLLARSSIKHDLVLRYCAPSSLEMPSHVKEYVATFPNARQEEYSDMYEAVQGSDVLYVTRVQKERFKDAEAFEKVKASQKPRLYFAVIHLLMTFYWINGICNMQGAYVVDSKLMNSAPSGMIIMHPLPRVDEIATEVDSDPRACYFREMENGMFVRMAILALILGTP